MSGARGRELRWRNTALICRCGYATPVTTKAIAIDALRRHVCRAPRQPAGLCLTPAPLLPQTVTGALEHYARLRSQHAPVVVDAVAVLKFAAGVSLPLNPHERFAVFALLRYRGWSVNRCVHALRLSWSSTLRFRTLLTDAAGITAAADVVA